MHIEETKTFGHRACILQEKIAKIVCLIRHHSAFLTENWKKRKKERKKERKEKKKAKRMQQPQHSAQNFALLER